MTCKYTYKYLEVFRKKREEEEGRGNERWCGPAYKYTYNLTYKYLGFFPNGEGACGKGVGEGASVFPRFFVGFRPGR